MRPSLGVRSPAISLISVVLPLPSGPTRPVSRPLQNRPSTPRSASMRPKRFATPCSATAARGGSGAPPLGSFAAPLTRLLRGGGVAGRVEDDRHGHALPQPGIGLLDDDPDAVDEIRPRVRGFDVL